MGSISTKNVCLTLAKIVITKNKTVEPPASNDIITSKVCLEIPKSIVLLG